MKYLFSILLFLNLHLSSFSQLSKGSFGNALMFDGEDDYAELPNVLTENFTIEICIKTNEESAKGLLAYHGSGIFDADFPDFHNDFTLSLLNDYVSFYDGCSKANIIGKTKVTDGKWHQITLTRKKGEFFKLYIDGKFEGQNKAGDKILNKKPIIHLATNRNYLTYTKMAVDEIRFWNRVLEPGEIDNNLFLELPENQNDLIAYYPISKENLNISDSLIDESGNGNHGKLINIIQKKKPIGAVPKGKKAWTYPLYKSPTFIGFLFLGLIFLIFIVVKIRVSILKRENKKLEKIVELRTKALEISLHDKDKLLHEKDVLLQEVHHRIKNNLQQISTLLEMQIQNVQEEIGKNVLKDAFRRISSMSLIHEMLYTSDDVSEINTKLYLQDLISKHQLTFNDDGKFVELIFDIESHNLNPSDAISFGMILSEIISNAYKHAYVEVKNPKLWIKLIKTNEDLFQLSVQDNGVGFDLNSLSNINKSFGLRLMHIFTKKLNGEILFSNNQIGLLIELNFLTSNKK